jgi:polar amino acid transport system substrate-binding protein
MFQINAGRAKSATAMRLTALILALCCLLAGSAALAAEADGSLQKVLDKKELVLGLDENFPPMGYRNEDGVIVGFDIDVATEVSARLGVALRPQPVDWSTKEAELNAGNIDCIWNGLTITPERQEMMRFSLPYLANLQVVAVRGDSDIQTLADLAGKAVGVQAGSSGADALAENAELTASLGNVAEFDDFMIAMLDLEKGGVDAVVVDIIVANEYIGKKGADFRLLDETVATESFGIGFRSGDATLCDAVNQTLQGMVADGKLAEISTTWFGSDITTIGK